jgi:hypothetical protein
MVDAGTSAWPNEFADRLRHSASRAIELWHPASTKEYVMSMRTLLGPLLVALALALVVSACTTGDTSGNGSQNGDPTVADADLIVPGERIGDLPPIGTAGSEVRAMGFDNERTAGSGTLYQWLDDSDETIWMLYVCAGNDAVTGVYIYDKPVNERFATTEGIGIGSGEGEVIAALGEPDDISEFQDNRTLRYFTANAAPGLTINFKVDALDSAHGIWVATRCDP